MTDKNIDILIEKYCTNRINLDEIQKLTVWLNNDQNKTIFQEYVALNFSIEELNEVHYSEKGEVWDIITKQIKGRKRKTSYWKYAVAASVAILITAGIWFTKTNNITEPQFIEPIIVNNNVETGSDKATLTLADGSDIALEKGQNYQANNVTSNGEEIIYNKVASKNIAYNTLTIPRGGQFFIKLSDGTKIWLNSETQLKYPESFTDGQTRNVELVYGEAYFEVSPSSLHNGATFKVFNRSQEIEVLGTQFNIKAHKDEVNIYTTLVEGKVAVIVGDQNVILTPNQQSNVEITNNNHVTIATVDTYYETSWKEGIFSFRGKPLKEIMKVISRWYDVDVVFENKELEGVAFKGVLGKNQDILVILSTLKNLSRISNFEINNKTITLK